ncbi:phosphatase PAP2 family protein [Albibacillus kandeliae]|uniref:phosphatase PAP2 family protein n=1 Tax=Albibacillus kandeliae TaxID=2174228 RepID=UPI000D692FE7|nr:phosphatase PAP2 family protein [Albibacillus kandeliae]
MTLKQAIASLSHRVEAVTLVIILAIAGALWAFVGLAAEMLEGDLHEFDERILLSLRTAGDLSNPIGGPQVEVAMRDLTALGGITVLTLLTLAVLAFLILRGQRASALFLAIAIVGGQVLSHLMKFSFARPRPELVPHIVEVSSASFPSGHSMMSAVTYLTLAVMLARTERRIRIRVFYIVVAAILTMLVGLSRVYLGVHWPSDVLGGWSLGAAWALGVWLLARRMGEHGQIEPEKSVDS